jgi:uncharacterized protein (DUF1800 family)
MLAPITAADWSPEDTAHLLNRAGFGASPSTVRQWHALGRADAVDRLLAAPAPEAPAARPAWFSPHQYKELAIAVRDERMQLMAENPPAAQEQARKRQLRKVLQDRQQAAEAAGWWMDRFFSSPAPLVEKMTLFWHGHFATSIEKVKDPYLMLQQNELFRTHALGNIRDLTKAVARDPAMMMYLDTDQSVQTKPNENFAREVMELFTLGEGHYTEQDVKEGARAFTGLKINRLLGRSFFHEPSWDPGVKEFLGESGRLQSDDVIDIIFRKPECARFLAGKVCAFFISDTPSADLVAAVAEELRRHDHAVAPVLRTIFLSAEFYAPTHRRAQIKSPVQFVVQARHALGLESLPRPLQLGILQQLGQMLFRPPNVAGWDGGRAWINTNTLLTRYNVAGFLVKGPASGYRPPLGPGRKPAQKENRAARDRLARTLARRAVANLAGVATPELRRDHAALLAALSERLFQTPLNDADRRPFEEYLRRQDEDNVTDTTLASLLHLMMSTPHYQLC